MEFKISFKHMPEYALVQTFGEATVQGFDDLLSALVKSPEWVDGTNQLVDHRELSATHLTNDDVQQIEHITYTYGKELAGGRAAFVLSDTESFGMIRMYELLGGEQTHDDIRVFYSIDEAVEWIKR
jgi:hypothetical protein